VTTAGADTFDSDAENRLIETNIASTTGTYEYNGDGLRTTRTIGASAVSYVWDLNASLPVILQDTDGNRYVYGLDQLTRIDGADEEWYLYDGLGSTTGLADDAGTVTGTYEYDVFGAVRAHTGGATEWSYTGEQNDPTGLRVPSSALLRH
jgi:YD repeat-containing protein